jgi:hypothetical protein
MAVTTFAARSFVQHFYLLPINPLVFGNYHLGNPVAGIDLKYGIRKIDEQYANLSPVIGINSTRRVYNANTMLIGQSAARTDLRLVTFGQLNKQPGFDQLTFHWFKLHRLLHRHADPYPRRVAFRTPAKYFSTY